MLVSSRRFRVHVLHGPLHHRRPCSSVTPSSCRALVAVVLTWLTGAGAFLLDQAAQSASRSRGRLRVSRDRRPRSFRRSALAATALPRSNNLCSRARTLRSAQGTASGLASRRSSSWSLAHLSRRPLPQLLSLWRSPRSACRLTRVSVAMQHTRIAIQAQASIEAGRARLLCSFCRCLHVV